MSGTVQYFYGRDASRTPSGHKFFNLRFFAGVPDDAKGATVDGDYEDIVDAYKAKNLPVITMDAGSPPPKQAPSAAEKSADPKK